jgi:HEAT repeat protein
MGLAKIGGIDQLKSALPFLDDPMCQYEAFAAVFGILVREKRLNFRIQEIVNPVGRRFACLAAGSALDFGIAAELSACAQDRHPTVRRAAALAMSSARSGKGGDEVFKMLMEDPDYWVRKIAKMAVKEGK